MTEVLSLSWGKANDEQRMGYTLALRGVFLNQE